MTYPGNMRTTANESDLTTYGLGTSYSFSYDGLGRAATVYSYDPVQQVWNGLAAAGYNEAGQLAGYWENNGASQFTRQYNSMGQMTNLTAGSNLNLTYTYNLNGQVTSVTDSVNGAQSVTSYTYDNLNRLWGANASGWTMTYGYDDFGNRKSQSGTGTAAPGVAPALNWTLTPDPATNQITDAGYVFDAAGNMTAMPGKTIVYDVFDRIQTVTTGSNTATMKYDAFGRRVEHDLPDGTQRIYFYDLSGRNIAEYDVPTSYYTYGQYDPTYISMPGPMRSKTYLAGQVVGQWSDRTGSTRYRPNGAVTSHYYPYDEEITTTANDTFKFAQTYRDSDSGLDYAVNRYYASSVGRFLTSDQPGTGDPTAPQTLNTYAYTNGDPVNGVDPSGTDTCLLNGSSTNCGFVWSSVCSGSASFVGLNEPLTQVLCGMSMGPSFGNVAGAYNAINAINNAMAHASPPPPAFAGIKMVGDCYDRSVGVYALGGGAPVRRITYTPIDQYGNYYSGAVSVSETNVIVQGQQTATNASWTTSGGNATQNSFTDYITAGSGQSVFQENQSFSGSAVGGTSASLAVTWYFGTQYGVLGAYATQQSVKINVSTQ